MEVFEIGDNRYLAFAALSDSAESVVFRCPLSSEDVYFGVYQALEVTHAVSLHFMSGVVPTLFVGVATGNSVMMHWNGSVFLGVNNASTAPSDAAGGQSFTTLNAQDILTLRREGKGDPIHGTGSPEHLDGLNSTDYLVLGNFGGRKTLPRIKDEFDPVTYRWIGRSRVDAPVRFQRVETEMLRGRVDAIFAMDGPTSVQVSPLDGRFVYVAAFWSRAAWQLPPHV